MSDLIMRVLVADDEAPFREELASINWCDYGCEFVGAASNGQEALMMCIEFIPHIIITDITMPVMDGLDVLKQVHYSFPQVKTVLLTCHEDFSFVKEAIALGAVDYILKRDLCTQEILRVINKCRNLIEQESFINSTKRMNQRKLLLKYLMAHKEGLTLDLCQTERYFRSIPFMPAYGQNAYFLYAGAIRSLYDNSLLYSKLSGSYPVNSKHPFDTCNIVQAVS
jgi:YesN/AraC family two-component response regulator